MSRNKKNRWMKGLNKRLISDVLELEPTSVEWSFEYPKHVRCTITTEHGVGTGLAICSTIEWEFDIYKGKNKAFGRAVKALKRKECGSPIRTTWNDFPNTWRKRQMDRVSDYANEIYKSVYEVAY